MGKTPTSGSGPKWRQPSPGSEYRTGDNVVVYGDATIDRTYGRHVFIDDDTVLSSKVRIHAHDASSQRMTGATFVAPVRIGKRCFIGSDSLILPGVTIGDDCVVAAGAVVTKDVPDDSIAAGVPARVIGKASELHERRRVMSETMAVLMADRYHGAGLPQSTQEELIELAERDGGYFITWDPNLGSDSIPGSD